MSEAIQGDIITEARKSRGDVHMELGRFGGVQFRTLSNLDMLIEADIITVEQFRAGKVYWRLRELLTRCNNPLFEDVGGDEAEAEGEPEIIDELTIEDPETFLALIGKHLSTKQRAAIDAACAAQQGPKYILVHAFGEGLIAQAFAKLEDAIPQVHEEMRNRLQSHAKRVALGLESYV